MLSNSGPVSIAFEELFSAYRGRGGHVLSASNGDLALTLAIRALGVPPGARAVVPSLSFPSAVHSLEWNGLVPQFVDVDARDWCLHPEQLDGQLEGVSLIVGTHLFGVPCDMHGLERAATDSGARLVLDAAQALATWVGDRHVTHFGDASVISFSGTKIVTGAEGGMALFREDEAAERFRRLRSYGVDGDGVSLDPGLNAKLSEIHAALAILSLQGLDSEVARRNELVELYRELLADVEDVTFQEAPDGVRVTPTFFVVAIRNGRERVREALAARRIESRYYFPALHLMPRLAGLSTGPLPVTEALGHSLLALPLYGDLDPEIVAEICTTIRDALGERRCGGAA